MGDPHETIRLLQVALNHEQQSRAATEMDLDQTRAAHMQCHSELQRIKEKWASAQVNLETNAHQLQVPSGPSASHSDWCSGSKGARTSLNPPYQTDSETGMEPDGTILGGDPESYVARRDSNTQHTFNS
eukprot:gene19651-6825_t